MQRANNEFNASGDMTIYTLAQQEQAPPALTKTRGDPNIILKERLMVRTSGRIASGGSQALKTSVKSSAPWHSRKSIRGVFTICLHDSVYDGSLYSARLAWRQPSFPRCACKRARRRRCGTDRLSALADLQHRRLEQPRPLTHQRRRHALQRADISRSHEDPAP